jgi:hypothetical protein
MCVYAARFFDLAAWAHIRPSSFSSFLVTSYKYIRTHADQAESRATREGCYDREAIFAEGRGVPSSDDVSGGRAAPIHQQALGRFLSIFPSRERDVSGTLAPIGSDTSTAQARSLAATSNKLKNNIALVKTPG